MTATAFTYLTRGNERRDQSQLNGVSYVSASDCPALESVMIETILIGFTLGTDAGFEFWPEQENLADIFATRRGTKRQQLSGGFALPPWCRW